MSHHNHSCCQSSKCCHHDEQCCSHDHKEGHQEECHFSQQLLDLADEAWMEVLKEKIKLKIESGSGKKLEQLAQLVAESNHARWKSLMAEKNTTRGFKQKVAEFFSKE